MFSYLLRNKEWFHLLTSWIFYIVHNIMFFTSMSYISLMFIPFLKGLGWLLRGRSSLGRLMNLMNSISRFPCQHLFYLQSFPCPFVIANIFITTKMYTWCHFAQKTVDELWSTSCFSFFPHPHFPLLFWFGFKGPGSLKT